MEPPFKSGDRIELTNSLRKGARGTVLRCIGHRFELKGHPVQTLWSLEAAMDDRPKGTVSKLSVHQALPLNLLDSLAEATEPGLRKKTDLDRIAQAKRIMRRSLRLDPLQTGRTDATKKVLARQDRWLRRIVRLTQKSTALHGMLGSVMPSVLREIHGRWQIGRRLKTPDGRGTIVANDGAIVVELDGGRQIVYANEAMMGWHMVAEAASG